MLEFRKAAAPVPAIDEVELHRMMDELSVIGGGEGGSMTRLTLSKEDGQARDWFAAWVRDHGLRLEVDGIGNMFGILDWAGPGAPTVMTGSHLDSQPNGGRFDGALGVVAACNAVDTIKRAVESGKLTPKANMTVVNWTNEEGARFQPSLLGSSVYSGALTLDFALNRVDGDNISVRDALSDIGYAGTSAPALPDAYIELHIEGSDKLEKAGLKFAAFTRYWGATKYRLAFLGKQAHTGPTPMAERQDAVLAAAYLIAELKAMADRGGLDLHTSVGRLEVFPNSPNVVPAEAVLFIELRSGSPEILESAEAEFKDRIEACAQRAGVGYEVRSVDYRKAGRMDEGLVTLATQTATSLGYETRYLDTIGGHDGVALADKCPSIVIAVPSVGGVIHHPTEFTTPEDRVIGTRILTSMLWDFCMLGNVLKG
ncbi:Zn-dependent hydrolase (plasmid) [Phyllobacterium sp. 628]|uniref:Zn-dependent hydrolase n=1 Tax=Phyllobacterium sp. 628 TaxID=2718938 RepID=UPI0016627721|nr:Zn-dependent hydrolase [Phyllobacterium sp. 628]QND54652.1 Zn-dependent hydrolase [Phyllobacterium sp. 628]